MINITREQAIETLTKMRAADKVELLANNLHIAVMRNPYLQFVLDGSKTMESRLSKIRSAPYNQVTKGDFILFKKSAGAILGLTSVEECWYFEKPNLDINWCRNEFNMWVRGEDKYWESKRDAKYASFFQFSKVARIPPIEILKSDGRPWVTL